MELLMCRDCGEFVTSTPVDGGFEPSSTSACPECGGTSFLHNGSGELVETD